MLKFAKKLTGDKSNSESVAKEDSQLKEDYAQLKEEYDNLREKYAEINAEYKKSSASDSELKVAYQNLVNENKRLESTLEKKRPIEYNEENKVLHSLNASLSEQIQQHKNSIQDLKAKRKTLIDEKLQLSLSKDAFKTQVLKLKTELEKLKNSPPKIILKENDNPDSTLQDKIEKLNEEISQLQTETIQLHKTVENQKKEIEEAKKSLPEKTSETFSSTSSQTKIKAIKSSDGHIVDSKEEQIIDNWLFNAQVLHVYKKRLPVEKEHYATFFIPSKKVYLHYLSENESSKAPLFDTYGLKYIEISSDNLLDLDDKLPILLYKFGIEVG